VYKFVQSTYINEQNKEQPCYLLGKQDILQMGAKESTYVRAKIIEYINVLESYIEESGQSEEFKYYRRTGKIIRRGLTDEILKVENQLKSLIMTYNMEGIMLELIFDRAKATINRVYHRVAI